MRLFSCVLCCFLFCSLGLFGCFDSSSFLRFFTRQLSLFLFSGFRLSEYLSGFLSAGMNEHRLHGKAAFGAFTHAGIALDAVEMVD